MSQWLTDAGRALRRWGPFNVAVTGVMRFACRRFDTTPESIIRHVHRVGIIRTPLPNGRMLSLTTKGDDWVSNQLYWRGWDGYEPETSRLFYELATRSGVVVDVGAYVGYYSLLASGANPAARVFAFEPHPKVFERLQANTRLNPDTNVTAVCVAVGNKPGEATFYTDLDSMPTSSGLSEEFFSRSTHLPTQVKVVTLDDYLDDHQVGPVDLVKIDTETTEIDVLFGFERRLQSDRPVVICEVLAGTENGQRLAELLTRVRYRWFLISEGGLSPQTDIVGHPRFFNYLFAPLELGDPRDV